MRRNSNTLNQLESIRESQINSAPTNSVDITNLPSIGQELLDRQQRLAFIRQQREIALGHISPPSNTNVHSTASTLTEGDTTITVNSTLNSEIITVETITPQQALQPNFFLQDPSARTTWVVSLPEDRFSWDEGRTQIQEKIMLSDEQMNLIQDVTIREMAELLNQALVNMGPVPVDFYARLADTLPYLFNLQNLNITVFTILTLFQVQYLTGILRRLTSGDMQLMYINTVTFLRYFRPLLIPYTNVIVWARYSLVGVDSLHSWIVGNLNRAIQNLNFRNNRVVEFPWVNRVVVIDQIRQQALDRLNQVRLSAQRRWSWGVRAFCGFGLSSFLFYLLAQLVRNPSQVFGLISSFFKQFGIIFSPEKLAQIFQQLYAALFSSPTNPEIIIEGISPRMAEVFARMLDSYSFDSFDIRLAEVLSILETFFY